MSHKKQLVQALQLKCQNFDQQINDWRSHAIASDDKYVALQVEIDAKDSKILLLQCQVDGMRRELLRIKGTLIGSVV